MSLCQIIYIHCRKDLKVQYENLHKGTKKKGDMQKKYAFFFAKMKIICTFQYFLLILHRKLLFKVYQVWIYQQNQCHFLGT